MPDWWELDHGTDPNVADDLADADHDGLVNRREYLACTDPRSADSDGGGENDLSELNHGRNPLDPKDDVGPKPTFTILPGNGKFLVNLAPMEPGTMIYVEALGRGETAGAQVYAAPVGGRVISERDRDVLLPAPVTIPLPNGAESCVRISLGVGDVTSDWSDVRCGTPSLDTYAPKLAVRAAPARSRTVRLEIEADDDPRDAHPPLFALDPASYQSGVGEMMIATSSDFAGAMWEPYTQNKSLRLSKGQAYLYVKVRDAAGNISRTAFVTLGFVTEGPLERAIFLEEDALDAMQSHDAKAAIASIHASLVPLDQAIQLAKHWGEDHEIAEELAEVRSAKKKAISMLGAKKLDEAREILRGALEDEVEQANRAARQGQAWR